MNDKDNNKRFSQYRSLLSGKSGLIFKIYFLAILFLLIFQLLSPKTTSFEGEAVAGGGDDVFEINDYQDVEMVIRTEKDDLSGIYIEGYRNELNLIFTNEKLHMSVTDEQTGELLAQSSFLMKNQMGSIDETGTYFVLDQTIPANRDIRVRIYSKGFKKRGVFYEVSDESLIDNTTFLDGDQTEQSLCATLYYRKQKLNILNPILYFLLEFVTGIILFELQRAFSIPFRSQEKKSTQTFVKKDVTRKELLVFSLTVLILMLVGAEFAYNIAVGRISRRYDADAVCVDDYNFKTRAQITDETYIEQVFTSSQNGLCGIAVRVQNNDDKEDEEEKTEHSFYVSDKEKEKLKNISATVKNVKGILNVQLFDEKTGELITENGYEVGTLRGISNFIAPGIKSGLVNSYKSNFVFLDFGKTIDRSKGGTYRVRITGRDTGENGIRLGTTARTNSKMIKNGDERRQNLCMVTLFNNNKAVTRWFNLIVILMIITVIGIGLLIKCFTIQIETIFLISLLTMGMIFSLLIPVYCVPDERTHADTIYRLSNVMLGIEEYPGAGRIYKRSCDVDSTIKNTRELTFYMYKEADEQLFRFAGENTELIPAYARDAVANVTVLNYIPGVIGFTFARFLGFNMLTMVMFARWATMITTSVLMFIAVRKVPFGKSVFAIIGLLPKMINQNISCSYDGMILAVTYLFIAYTLSLAYEAKTNITDLLVVTFSAYFLAANKGGCYFPLILLILLIPANRDHSRKAYTKLSLELLISSLAVFSFKFIVRIVGMLFRVSGNAVRPEGGQVLYTFSDFFSDPGKLLRLYENTALMSSESLLGSMIGAPIAQAGIILSWPIIIAFILLMFVAALIHENEKERFTNRHRLFIAVITVIGICMISASMLLSWTPYGNDTIQGLQGRYFLPYLILPVLCLQNKYITKKKLDDRVLVWIADVLLFMVFICLMAYALYCSPDIT